MLLSEKKDLRVFALASITLARSSRSSIARTLSLAAGVDIVRFRALSCTVSFLKSEYLNCKCPVGFLLVNIEDDGRARELVTGPGPD